MGCGGVIRFAVCAPHGLVCPEDGEDFDGVDDRKNDDDVGAGEKSRFGWAI
jgi:hypothetical protein